MANTHDNSPMLQKQIILDVKTIDKLTAEINQLESLIDLFSVAIDIENSADFKQNTLVNVALMMQELIDEIKDIFVKEIVES